MINAEAVRHYRDYLNEADPIAREMLRQAYYRAIQSADEVKTWPPGPAPAPAQETEAA